MKTAARSRFSPAVLRRATGFVAALAVAAGAFASFLPTPAAAQQKTTLRVAYIPVVTWLPMLIAQDKGFFAQHGLTVTLTKFPNIVNLPGTVGRQFDLVPTTPPDILNGVASGLNLAAVAGETLETSQNKSFIVMVRPDGSIKTVKDLAGKRIASPSVGSVMHIAVLHWVKEAGGDPGTVTGIEVPFPNMMDQLKAGRVDAAEQLQPFVGQMLAKGYKPLGDPLLAIADPVLFTFWIADANWARAHRALLKEWVASLEQGLQVIKTDNKAARAVLVKYSGLPDAVVARIPMPHYDFKINPAELDVWRKVLVSQGRPLQHLDVDKIVVTAE